MNLNTTDSHSEKNHSRFKKLIGSRHSLRGTLVRGSFWSAVIKVSSKLVLLAFAAILSRELGAEGYGIYAFAFSVLAIMRIFAVLGIPTLLMREIAAAQVNGEWSYFRGILVRGVQTVLLMSLLVAFIMLLFMWVFTGEMSQNKSETIYWSIAMLPPLALVATIAGALKGMHHVVTAQAISLLFRPVTALLCVIAVLYTAKVQLLPQNMMAIQMLSTFITLVVSAIIIFRFLPGSPADRLS